MLKVKRIVSKNYKYGTTSMNSKRASSEVKVFFMPKEQINKISERAISDHERHLKKMMGFIPL